MQERACDRLSGLSSTESMQGFMPTSDMTENRLELVGPFLGRSDRGSAAAAPSPSGMLQSISSFIPPFFRYFFAPPRTLHV